MHKPASNEVVTSLHDLSAVDLIAGYRARQFSPTEVLEDVLAHIAVWEPHIKALYAFDPDGARAVAKASTERWHKGEPIGRARRRSRHNQGEYRHQGRAGAAGCCDHQTRARRCRCAAGGALARSGRGDFFQNHDAGLRHAVVGALQLPSPHPQSLGSVAKIPAAPAPAPAPRAPPVTARCISAPTSAVRCGCRRAGAAWLR